MKKFLSILLILVLALSCGITAYAEPTNHPKIAPAVFEAIEALPEHPEDGEGLCLVVYFNDEYKSVDKMQSWPSGEAMSEYARYVVDRNNEIVCDIFEEYQGTVFCRSFTRFLPGCVLMYDYDADRLSILEQSEHVKFIDVFDQLDYMGYDGGKYNMWLHAALKAHDEDDWINLWVGNNAHVKTLREMPSWPAEKGDRREDEYKMYKARNEYSAYIKGIEDKFFAEAFEGVEVIYRSTGMGNCTAVSVKVSDIEKIASRDCVRYVGYLENSIPENEAEPDIPDLQCYGRKLCDQYLIKYEDLAGYEELYYHSYDPDDKPYGYDWVLVKGAICDGCYCCVLHPEIVGGRLLTASSYKWYPFTFDYGIYDAEQDRFFDLAEIDFDDYEGLYEVWQSTEISSVGGRIYLGDIDGNGDADGDGKCTILDATKIQRGIADLCPKQEIVAAQADVDGDGAVTVLDATIIQRSKAGLGDYRL